jgi:TIR domain
MIPNSSSVPVQPLASWNSHGANSILGAHCGNLDYQLLTESRDNRGTSTPTYRTNEDAWHDIIGERVFAGQDIVLERFQIMDWFPRAPGLYHTRDAAWAREMAFEHMHPTLSNSPVNNRKSHEAPRVADDYTVVFTPEGKLSMLEGGIGCIRLKPIQIEGASHWLITATSDGTVHCGVPIAVPLRIYRQLSPLMRDRGSASATITGQICFLDDPISRVFDRYAGVPKVYLKVSEIELCDYEHVELGASVAVSFVSDYQHRPSVYTTYVTFEPNIRGSFEEAISWMKTKYVEGEYEGRIITDFDQTKTVFPEARLALASVMDREITRGGLRESIELMHATASVDHYFSEIERNKLLFAKQRTNGKKIFISYAHRPERQTGWVARIRTHLQGIVKESDFEVWDDTRIETGATWRDEIERSIRQSKAVIIVLTADFCASKFIRDEELPLLLEVADAARTRIICIYGSAVHLTGTSERLTKYQFLNSSDEPLQALTEAEREDVYRNLARTVDELIRPSA